MEAVAETIEAPPSPRTFVDRRSYKRFKVQSGAIASSQLTVVGQIINISHGGLVFRYVASRKRSNESPLMKIALTDGSFRLDWIPFSVAWDIPKPQSYSCGPISLRYCAVVFGNLTDYQKLQLHYFIKHHARVDPEV